MKRKQKNKKKVIGVIGLTTAAFCSFGIASVANVSADTLYGGGVIKVYADEVSDVYTTQWNEAIAELKSINGDISTRDNYVKYIYAYNNASDAYSRISATVLPEDEVVWQNAGAIIRKDAESYKYFANTLSKLYANKSIAWSHKVAYDDNVSYYNSLDAMKQGVFADIVKFAEMRDYADSEFIRIENAMKVVIEKIDSIYYVDGKIVVNSEDSLDKVAEAIKEIYGKEYSEISKVEVDAIATYVEKLGDYDKALADYQVIVDTCTAMDSRIVSTYNAFTSSEGENYNKHYTQRLIIETLRTDYNALNRGVEDDATALITESGKLVELETVLAKIDADKVEVEKLISDIPVDFDYTDAYIKTATDAKGAFDLLPEDLKAVADIEIADYSKLVDALEAIEICDNQVKALIEKAKNLQVLFDEGSEKFTSEVNAVSKERTLLKYAKQKADFDAECGELLFDMQTKVDNLSEKTGPFIDAVLAIGEVKLSNTAIGSQIQTAYAEYAKLTEVIEQNAVLGYKKILDEKKNALDDLMVEANAWKNAVLSIVLEEKITTQNIADIQDVALGLNEIKDNNLDMYTVISTSGSTYGYAEFQALINAVEYLFGDIAQLANDMVGLSTDLSVIVADPATFNQAIENATANFNALDDSVKAEYFTADTASNKSAYDIYLIALNMYNKVAKLAGDIAALYDISTVNMTKYDAIMSYNASYEALDVEDKAILATQKINNDKTFEEVLVLATEKVEGLKKDREAWTDSVYALAGEIEKANWGTDLYSVNLKTIETLKAQRVNLDNTDNLLDEVDADLALIETIANDRITYINDLIEKLDDKGQLEESDIITLESIYDIYNNKFDQTQKDLVDYKTFEVLYNRYVFAQNFDEVVLELKKDVIVNKNYTSEVPITIGILRSVYITFGGEMKALIQEYATLDEIEADYNAHVDNDGEVLNLTGVYNELIEKIEEDGSNLSAEISSLATQIADLNKDIEALEQSLADAKAQLAKADADNKQELIDLINALETKVNTLKSDLEKADADIIADISKVREELAGVKADLEKLVEDTKAELKAEIEALEQSLADAKAELVKADADNKQELIDLINALETKVNTLKSDLEKADADIIADISKVREELASVKADLEKLVDDTKAELKAEIEGLRNSLTTVTVILSIVSGLSLIGVVVLFVLKKKN